MIALWLAYLVAAVGASGVFVVAGWPGKQAHGFTSARIGSSIPTDPLLREAHADDAGPQTDAGGALRTALQRLAPLMASQGIQADLAASFGLLVQMRGSALVDLLEDIISAAIHAAPTSRLLLTATANSGCVAICVTDDIPNADAERRRAGIRGLKDRVARRGAILDLEVKPAEGTTMTLRLDHVRAGAGHQLRYEPLISM